MKKNLAFLTGIVFVLTILLAVGCGNRKKQNDLAGEAKDPPQEEKTPTAVRNNSTKVDIFLKEKLTDGVMHLEMYDSRDTTKKKIDSLETVVYPGDTVTFKKAFKSNIKQVTCIRLDEEFHIPLSEDVKLDRGLYKLMIDTALQIDTTVKYDIKFIIKKDPTEWIVDPYLRIKGEGFRK